MPNTNHTTDILRVKQIVIDEEGNVARRFPRIDAEGQLKNTLLFAIHPEICVLSMQVPGGLLDAYEQARISQVLMRVRYEGREYCLVGASGSAKDGKFYAVDAQHEKLIAERFQKWPQAAITSRPREYRVNAGMPFSSRVLWNRSMLSSLGSL